MFNEGSRIRSLLSFLLVLEFAWKNVTSNINEPSFPIPENVVGSSGGSSSSSENIGGGGTTANGFVWSPRQVVTKLGIVQGFIVRPPNGYGGVEVFLNLPYASPPEGPLRFKPPESGSPWKGTRRSESPSPVCPQVLPNIKNESEALKMMPRGRLSYLRRLLPHLTHQSENCLFLNIYIPVTVAEGKADGKLPVLVFIHGDSFAFGGGHPYNPTMLVSLGQIIVITMNYRLGIFGFLNADADGHFKLPFNFALLDQIAALQWIQENIEVFGGDKSRVTLMGHGKGAVCVNFLMISNAVPIGLLFHRVILSSGSALSPLTADLSKGPELARKFARKVKCPTEPSSTMLQCLRSLWTQFGPSGDGIVVKHSLPSENFIMHRVSSYPLLFGVTNREIVLNDREMTFGVTAEKKRELLKQFIEKYLKNIHRSEILAGALYEYTNWENINAQHPINVRDEILEALADAQIVAPLIKLGDLHASASSRTKAYFYVFEYQSKNSEYQQRLGCVHGNEIPYIFGAPLYFYEGEFNLDTSSSVGEIPPFVLKSDYHPHHIDQHSRYESPPQQKHPSSRATADITMTGGSASAAASTRTSTASYSMHEFQQQRKEKWRKRNERIGGLGFFAGNFTWYEVQLSATVIQFWSNFVKTGNPNGEVVLKPVAAAVHSSLPSSSLSEIGTYQKETIARIFPVKSNSLASDVSKSGVKSRRIAVKDEGEVMMLMLNDEKNDFLTSSSASRSNNERVSRESNGNNYNSNNNHFVTVVEALGPTPLQEPQHQQHYHQPPPIFMEWPEYDSLDKKYLMIDVPTRIRYSYRRHKLSLWHYLVPTYQKNTEGTGSSIHHEMSGGAVFSMISPPGQNLSKMSAIQPTIFASGLHHDHEMGLSDGDNPAKTKYHLSSRNSSENGGGGKKSRNRAGATKGGLLSPIDTEKQQDSAFSSSINPGDPLESAYGFHTYSTALSVTIAIGCSLLILNFLIFVTFYYEREKRRQEHRRHNDDSRNVNSNQGDCKSDRMSVTVNNVRDCDDPDKHLHLQRQSSSRHSSLHRHQRSDSSVIFRQQSSSSGQDSFPIIPLTTTNISAGYSASNSASLKRRRDNSNNVTTASTSLGPAGNLVMYPHHSQQYQQQFHCKHYVNEEGSSNDLTSFGGCGGGSDLYSSPFLENEELARLHSFEEDEDEEMAVVVTTTAAAVPIPTSSSSHQHILHSSVVSDMNYGQYGGEIGGSCGGGGKISTNINTTSSSNVLERGFIPITPTSATVVPVALPSSVSAAPVTFVGGSGSLRQKRQAFAIGSVGASSRGFCNEFSMSDVRVEPVTNATNFSSPQEQSTLTSTFPELLEIETIPTVEELIQAHSSNSSSILLPTSTSAMETMANSNSSQSPEGSDKGSESIETVVVVPSPPPFSLA